MRASPARVRILLFSLVTLMLLVPWIFVGTGALFPRWGGHFGFTAEGVGQFITSFLFASMLALPIASALIFVTVPQRLTSKILSAALGGVLGIVAVFTNLQLLRAAITIIEEHHHL